MGGLMTFQDKRKHPRVRYRQQVLINKVLPAIGDSISVGGIFLYTEAIFTPDHKLQLQLVLHQLPLQLNAVVRHYRSGIGVGLMFVDLSEEQELLLLVYVNEALQEQTRISEKGVLLLDNNTFKRKLYREALERAHYKVAEATSVVQALDVLKADSIGVVVFNPFIPGGFTLAKRMRLNPTWNSIALIILSSHPVPEETRRRELPMVKHLFLQSAMPPARLPQVVAKYL
jgi:CheY-like chemotaxis protein